MRNSFIYKYRAVAILYISLYLLERTMLELEKRAGITDAIGIISGVIIFTLGILIHKYLFNEPKAFLRVKWLPIGLVVILPYIFINSLRLLNSEIHLINGFMTLSVLFSALVEEVFHRGIVDYYIVSRLKDFKKVGMYIIISGLFFGVIHLLNFGRGQALDVTIIQVIGAAIDGLLYSFALIISRSIWPSLISHFIHNYIILITTDIPWRQVDSVGRNLPWQVHAVGIGVFINFAIGILIISRTRIVQNHINKVWKDKRF